MLYFEKSRGRRPRQNAHMHNGAYKFSIMGAFNSFTIFYYNEVSEVPVGIKNKSLYSQKRRREPL